MVASKTTCARVGAVLAAPLVLSVALAGPAGAAPRPGAQPVLKAAVTCVGPGEGAELGGALVELRLRPRVVAADDVYVLVPVDGSTGLDVGPRTTVRPGQHRASALVPADGRTLTPAASLEVRVGGDVLQRIAVPAGCGVLDPVPDAGPVVGAITAQAGTVTVPVTNGSSIGDDIGVSLFPAGGTTGETRFLTLAPGATGTVTFTGVAPGEYTVEAFGYSSFLSVETAPFTVG